MRRHCPLLNQFFTEFEEDHYDESTISLSKAMFLREEFPSKPVLKLTFESSDLSCLKSGGWLNDQILNSYISLMGSRTTRNIGFTNSFFMSKLERDGSEAASCWQGIKGKPICRFDQFLVPICNGSHWILACFDFVENLLLILDSFHGKHARIGKLLNQFLEYQGNEKMQVYYPEVPSQLNCDDCGVFVLRFCKCFFDGEDLMCFSQRDIAAFRRQIRKELVEAKQ